jgi:hypothetical protein
MDSERDTARDVRRENREGEPDERDAKANGVFREPRRAVELVSSRRCHPDNLASVSVKDSS